MKLNFKIPIILVVNFFLADFKSFSQSFESEQKDFPRVKFAYSQKESTVLKTLDSNKIAPNSLEILIKVLKKEQKLELWAKDRRHNKMQLIKKYNVCQKSGRQGPKRTQGDGQVPEGIYEVAWFNPESAFHLSLGLNYPNASDQILSNKSNPGSAIMIHGSCVTIGCIPMTNPIIEEIYIYAVKARNAGQIHIPIYVFPQDLGGNGLNDLYQNITSDSTHFTFWSNLKEGFDLFETNKLPLIFTVDKSGRYAFRK